MIQRIASDEPEELGALPTPITFWYRGAKHQASVSSSAIPNGRWEKYYPGTSRVLLEGDHGRAWLTDACSMALQDGLHAARVFEDAQAYQDRMARRRAKADLAEQEAAARRTKTARW
jgi:hypothetical protein